MERTDQEWRDMVSAVSKRAGELEAAADIPVPAMGEWPGNHNSAADASAAYARVWKAVNKLKAISIRAGEWDVERRRSMQAAFFRSNRRLPPDVRRQPV